MMAGEICQGFLRPLFGPNGNKAGINCECVPGCGRARWWHLSWEFATPDLESAIHNLVFRYISLHCELFAFIVGLKGLVHLRCWHSK